MWQRRFGQLWSTSRPGSPSGRWRQSRACSWSIGYSGSPVAAGLLSGKAASRGAGRFGGALYFPKKGTTRPSFKDGGVLGYNAKSWSAGVSVWLRLDPDKDLEPGYCDPIQIVGNDSKKGYIFLEWSKDETPRLFRYAIRPLFHIWNPNNQPLHEIPADKKPAVEVARAPFARDKWTHDHLLSARRGVNFRAIRRSTNRLTRLSTQPKHSASSSASL